MGSQVWYLTGGHTSMGTWSWNDTCNKLTNWQSVCRTIWRYVGQKAELMLYHNTNIIWAIWEYWIFCISLTLCMCNDWRNLFPRICWSIRRHFMVILFPFRSSIWVHNDSWVGWLTVIWIKKCWNLSKICYFNLF